MKLKSLVVASALAITVPLFGQSETPVVESSNTFGILKVESGSDVTIVAIPWVECGTGEAVKVANLVKTDNLTKGDQLYVYEKGTWLLFLLGDSAWEAATTAAENGGVPAITTSNPNKTISRGSAVILKRQDTTKPFYLYGQESGATASVTAIGGSAAAPGYTALASPSTSDVLVSSIPVGAKDSELRILEKVDGEPAERTYRAVTFDGSVKWAKFVVSGTRGSWTEVGNTDTIPAGVGFWYVNTGSDVKIDW